MGGWVGEKKGEGWLEVVREDYILRLALATMARETDHQELRLLF